MYVKYTDEVYDEAKEYALSNMELFQAPLGTYCEYTFFERNMDLYYTDIENDNGIRVVFAYSDEQHILLFTGIYDSTQSANSYNPLPLEEYVTTYFPFYNFEEGKIERETETESVSDLTENSSTS